VVGCKYTNHRFSLRILQPEKRTLVLGRPSEKESRTTLMPKTW
jgi:hypothetical protein